MFFYIFVFIISYNFLKIFFNMCFVFIDEKNIRKYLICYFVIFGNMLINYIFESVFVFIYDCYLFLKLYMCV